MNTKETIILDLIKALRKSNKYSQLEFSNKIGLSIHHYSRKELNKNKFTIPEVIEIFNILDVKLIVNDIYINDNLKLIELIRNKRNELNITQDFIRQELLLKTHAAYFNKEKGIQYFYLDEFINICEILNLETFLDYHYDNESVVIRLN